MTNVTEIVLSQIHPEWKKLFFNSTDTRLVDLLDETIRNVMNTGHKLCPDNPSKILKCLSINPEDMKAVIVGQDPYPQPGIAQGTAFSCIGKFQPSLSIMVRELEQEYQTSDLALTFDGTLKPWVDQGVVLLNASLTCEQWKPNSHFAIWQPFMTELFKIFNEFNIQISESVDAIKFMTIHSAKGLEFPVVLLPMAKEKLKFSNWLEVEDPNLEGLHSVYIEKINDGMAAYVGAQTIKQQWVG